MKETKIPAYVLAGGQSCRLGYDKLFVSLNETSLLERTIATVNTVFEQVKIVAKEKGKFKKLTTEVIIDSPLADGPMAGLITALEDCSEAYCFITAADFYDLTAEHINKIVNSYNNEQYFGMNINNHIQPLCGIYNRSSLPELKKIAQTENYKMKNTLEYLDCRLLPIAIIPWRNINYPDDLEEIRRHHV